MLLEGLQLPLTTPFYPDGRLNLLKLEHNARRYSKTPAAGLVVLSGYGESTLLSDEESRQVLRSAINAAEPQKVMLAGVSRDSIAGTLDLAENAAELGYDAVLVRRPSILRAPGGGRRMRELLTYFRAVADRSALPVVLSSGVSEHGEMLSTEVVIELAAHPQIVGAVDGGGGRDWIEKVGAGTTAVKHEVTVTTLFRAVTARMRVEDESTSNGGLITPGTLTSGSTALAAALPKEGVKTRLKVVGFQLLVGGTAGILEGLMAGAVGAAPGFAASTPQACYEVLAAWKDGDEGLAREKQERLHDVARRVEEELGIAGIKFGCDLNGYFGGRPRLPLLPLTGEERTEVERLIQGLRN
jgi:4-hydroxy-2-oxoglutarate aldolase